MRACPDAGSRDLVGVQLTSLDEDLGALGDWGYGVPVDLVMLDPAADFGALYRCAKLLDKHPVLRTRALGATRETQSRTRSRKRVGPAR